MSKKTLFALLIGAFVYLVIFLFTFLSYFGFFGFYLGESVVLMWWVVYGPILAIIAAFISGNFVENPSKRLVIVVAVVTIALALISAGLWLFW